MVRTLDRSAHRRNALAAAACLSAIPLGLVATGAQAALVTWELKGTITESQIAPSPDSPTIPVGTPFRLLVTYDTTVPYTTSNSTPDPVTGLPRSGIRYQYFGEEGLKFALYAGDCNPCTPAYIPERNGILVRDDFADPGRNPAPDVPYDGYTFYLDPHPDDDDTAWQVIFRDQSTRFTPNIVNVAQGANPLPIEPDSRLTQMAESGFNISNRGNGDFLGGRIESVGIPTYGTAYILTARDCSYPDFNPNRVSDDCFSSGVSGLFNRYSNEGGGPGQGDFSILDTAEFPIWAPAPPAPRRSLGTVFGSVTFGGPSALPVVKASSYPIDVARNNGNVQAYQLYRYKGAVKTSMPLVADLTYQIRDNRVRPSNLGNLPDPGLHPGVGIISATLAIIDGNVISAADMANAGFGHRNCGSESDKDPDGNLARDPRGRQPMASWRNHGNGRLLHRAARNWRPGANCEPGSLRKRRRGSECRWHRGQWRCGGTPAEPVVRRRHHAPDAVSWQLAAGAEHLDAAGCEWLLRRGQHAQGDHRSAGAARSRAAVPCHRGAGVRRLRLRAGLPHRHQAGFEQTTRSVARTRARSRWRSSAATTRACPTSTSPRCGSASWARKPRRMRRRRAASRTSTWTVSPTCCASSETTRRTGSPDRRRPS